MSSRILTTSLLVLLLFGAAALLRRPEPATEGSAADSPLAQDYDYTISNMQLDSFTPDGRLQYQLVSGRVTHYPEPDHSTLENPRLHWFEPEQPDWVLTARSGDLREDAGSGQTRLLLQDDVLASRTGDDGATLDVRSESLLVLPDAGELRTTDAIQLQDGKMRLASAGMQAWLRENRIKLSAGRGQHE